MDHGTCVIGEGGCSKTGAIIRGWCQKHYSRLRLTGSLHTKRIMGDDEARFWSMVDRAGDDECWLWTGTTGEGGYGVFYADGGLRRAHRWAYGHFVGPIPDDKPHIEHACHSRDETCRKKGACDHRRCVNFLPRGLGTLHLEAVTKRVNNQRAHRSPHSRELIRSLYIRWASGELLSALAAEKGMTLAALYSRFVSLESEPGHDIDRPNRRPRRLTPELVVSLHDRYLAGESVRALGDEIGMDATSIYYQFRRLKDLLSYEPWSQGTASRRLNADLTRGTSVPRPLIAVTGQPQELPGLFD